MWELCLPLCEGIGAQCPLLLDHEGCSSEGRHNFAAFSHSLNAKLAGPAVCDAWLVAVLIQLLTPPRLAGLVRG